MNSCNEVRRVPVQDQKFVATLFIPVLDRPLPSVITLSGSGGGLNEHRAQTLALKGYVTMALAYFGCPGLPAELEEIPLEYFLDAVEWLKKRPEVDQSSIGLWGTSRGGELALVLGALFPDQMAAIVAYVPSSIVYSSQGKNDRPAWTYKGAPALPFARFVDVEKIDTKLGFTADKPIVMSPYCLQEIEQSPALYASAAIPVERIKTPLLLFAGENDLMWPSAYYTQQIMIRLTSMNSRFEKKSIIYKGAGHDISVPGIPPIGTVVFHPLIHKWFAFGGSEAANARAGENAWEETLSFFARNLK